MRGCHSHRADSRRRPTATAPASGRASPITRLGLVVDVVLGVLACAHNALAGAEKRRRTDYTRGAPVRGPSGNRLRERSSSSGWREVALLVA
jgi:hypothetical protein